MPYKVYLLVLVLFVILWYFLHMQVMTLISTFPILCLLFLLLPFLHWPLVQCWIGMARIDILALFLIWGKCSNFLSLSIMLTVGFLCVTFISCLGSSLLFHVLLRIFLWIGVKFWSHLYYIGCSVPTSPYLIQWRKTTSLSISL